MACALPRESTRGQPACHRRPARDWRLSCDIGEEESESRRRKRREGWRKEGGGRNFSERKGPSDPCSVSSCQASLLPTDGGSTEGRCGGSGMAKPDAHVFHFQSFFVLESLFDRLDCAVSLDIDLDDPTSERCHFPLCHVNPASALLSLALLFLQLLSQRPRSG